MTRSNIKKSQRQEDEVAERYKGSRTPQSGAGWAVKNDVRTNDLLIECKFTNNKRSITLKSVDLEGVMTNALLSGRLGILQFELNGKRYVVLDDDDFNERFLSEEER